MTTEQPPTLGLVLAGGLARRMGGGDKPRTSIGAVTILSRVLERLKPQCTRLILNANGDPATLANPAILKTFIADLSWFAGRHACRPAPARLPMQQGTTGLSTARQT